jgi:hypothetical protein
MFRRTLRDLMFRRLPRDPDVQAMAHGMANGVNHSHFIDISIIFVSIK